MNLATINRLRESSFRLLLHECDGLRGLFTHCYRRCTRDFTYHVDLWDKGVGEWRPFGTFEWCDAVGEWILETNSGDFIWPSDV